MKHGERMPHRPFDTTRDALTFWGQAPPDTSIVPSQTPRVAPIFSAKLHFPYP
jgi:hypothetical protein